MLYEFEAPKVIQMNWTSKLFLVAAPLLAIAYAYSSSQRQEEQTAIDEAAMAVEVLPSGVEYAWREYVDDQLKMLIQRRESHLLIVPIFNLTSELGTYVSLNMPYTIECSAWMGGEVTFGTGEDTFSVPIFGSLASIRKSGVQPPELGVHAQSVAKENLDKILCLELVTYMGDITKP